MTEKKLGGKRKGAGRKSIGRARRVIYATDEEYMAIRAMIRNMRQEEATDMEKTDEKILIVSGQGTTGTIEEYKGTRSARGLKLRLAKERSGGDRWAKAYIFSHSGEWGDVYVNFEDPNDMRYFEALETLD